MAVRVKLSLTPLTSPNASAIEAVALVNSGYEAGRVELIVPPRLAEKLGWWPVPSTAIPQAYGSAGGAFHVHRLPGALRVVVEAPHRVGPWVVADAVIAPQENEVLISDALAGPLGLVLLEVAKGLWTFRDELDRSQASEPRQIW